MPYYGDHAAGDPGLFGFVRRIKLGRIIGSLVKSAFPGSAGVLSAVNAIRGGVKGSPLKEQIPGKELTVAVPKMLPTARVTVRSAGGGSFRAKPKTAKLSFAQILARQRARAARARARRS